MIYRLECWRIVVPEECKYTAPELVPLLVEGAVYGNPRFEDGDPITTSSVVEVSGRIITTYSGSRYRLGEVDPRYKEWLDKNYLGWDPENPIRERRKNGGQ